MAHSNRLAFENGLRFLRCLEQKWSTPTAYDEGLKKRIAGLMAFDHGLFRTPPT